MNETTFHRAGVERSALQEERNAKEGTRMSSSLRRLPTDLADGRLLAREPGWEFSLMLSFEVLFLFGAVPLLSGDRNVVTLLQLGLATTSIALIAKSTMLRLVLAGTFAAILLGRLLPSPFPRVTTLSAVLLYNVLVTGAMVRAVFGPGDVNHHRIAGSVVQDSRWSEGCRIEAHPFQLYVPDHHRRQRYPSELACRAELHRPRDHHRPVVSGDPPVASRRTASRAYALSRVGA